MVFSPSKSSKVFFSFSVNPKANLVLISFHFPSWTYPPILSFLFPCFIHSFKDKEESSFSFFTTNRNASIASSPWESTRYSPCYNGDRKGYINHFEYICGVIKALEVVSKPYLFLLNIFCVQIILHNTTPFPSKHLLEEILPNS